MWMPLYSRMWILMLNIHDVNILYSMMWILMLIIHDVNIFVQQDVNTDVDYPRCKCLCTVGREYLCWLSTMRIPPYSRTWILMLIIHDVNAFVQQNVNTDVDYPRCECLCTAGREYWCWLSTMWIYLYSWMWILMLIIHAVNASVQQDVNTDVDYPRCECLCTVGCEFWCWLSTMWILMYSRMWILMLIIRDVNTSVQ